MARTQTVHPGQSIQAAVNRAHAGDTIIVRPGRYHENVLIKKNGITLRGSGASSGGTVLLPPARPSRSVCGQVKSGICVFGDFNFRTGHIKSYVHNVRITGFMINNFHSFGVVAFAAANTRMDNNSANNNGEYGLTGFASTRTQYVKNRATGSGEAGIYVGDSPDAHALVIGNNLSGNSLGIFIRHARGVEVAFNNVQKNCQGILVLDDGEKGGAGNADIRYNYVHANNKVCRGGDEAPPLSGGGILLLGATHNTVANNSVLNNGGNKVNSGGIVLISAAPFGGSNAHDNVVRNNTAYRNAPADIRWDGRGQNNVFYRNHCDRSSPRRICN